jgi:hypothetical protein
MRYLLCSIFITLFTVISYIPQTLQSQNTYLGPIQPIPGNPQLVRIQISVRDSPESGGPQVQSVSFAGYAIPLKPRDVYGNRGGASFQLPPGKQKLVWKVRRDKTYWPRVISREEEVTIDPKDYWIQISIVGESATIG